jgi:hypothetical protein
VRPPASQARRPPRQANGSSPAALAGAARRSPDPTARRPERGLLPLRFSLPFFRRAERCGQTKPRQLLDNATNVTRPTTGARPAAASIFRALFPPRGALRPDGARTFNSAITQHSEILRKWSAGSHMN